MKALYRALPEAYPLMAAAQGWIAGLALSWLAASLGRPAAAAVVLAVWIALQAARRERAVSVVFWKWTAALAVVVRWHALARLVEAGPGVVAACAAVASASMVAQAYLARPVDNAGPDAVPAHLGMRQAITTSLLGLGLAWLAGFPRAVVILCAAAFLAQALVRWFDRKDGGMSASALQASHLLVETVAIAVASQV